MVVGMHRSATSLVAKGLHGAGVHMGDDLIGPARSNPAGHFEDKQVVAINDRILKDAGGAWDRPPPHDAICAVDTDQPAAHVASREGMWGMKDPRLSLTWPLWLPHLPDDLHVLWIRRGPAQVARSLNVRDGIPTERGVELAEVYRQRIGMLQEALDV